MNNVRYRSNSHISKKPKVVRSNNLVDDVISSILPSKEEFICDILLPTIRRSIRSKLYE